MTPAENVVVEFEKRCVFASAESSGAVNPDELNISSLCGLIGKESLKTFAVGMMVCTRAAPPLPPVPSLMNVTESPTENPSPGSIMSNELIVASDTEATLIPASLPPPPVTVISSPTV